jgi:hypothetical protein
VSNVLVYDHVCLHECRETLFVQLRRHTADLVFFALFSVNFVEILSFFLNVPPLQIVDDRNVVNVASVMRNVLVSCA